MDIKEKQSKIKIILAMVIFGTVGIFRRYIPLSSAFITFSRSFIGCIFLSLLIIFSKKKIRFCEIKSQLPLLVFSGIFLGANWLCFFESFNYMSVANATLCYYMGPIIVIFVSPFIFKEKLTLKKIICIFAAIAGVIIISGKIGFEGSAGGSANDFKGIIYGLIAAVLYAAVIICNKKIVGINPYHKTAVQLGVSTVVLLIYMIVGAGFREIIDFREVLGVKGSGAGIDYKVIILLIFVGVLHTGIAYILYFGSIDNVPAQTAALLSYIDPIIAIVLGSIILKEKITLIQIEGSILILGSTAFLELTQKNGKNKDIEKK